MNQKIKRVIDDAKRINLIVKYTAEEIKDIIKRMSDAARDIYGVGVLDNCKLMILVTGGSGDFSITINVR